MFSPVETDFSIIRFPSGILVAVVAVRIRFSIVVPRFSDLRIFLVRRSEIVFLFPVWLSIRIPVVLGFWRILVPVLAGIGFHRNCFLGN